MTGTVFDLKEYAIYDGPGVRQTVFLKGCPLRCAWCHNPEGLSSQPQLSVAAGSCIGCGACEKACGGDWDRTFQRSTDCHICGRCIPVCPLGLRTISGTVYTPEVLAEKLMKNAPFYASLGGGVTFSGGEPLMQGEFLCEVMDLLPGIHKTIETSGYAESGLFERVLTRLDHTIMDIKLMNCEEHRRWTGVPNRQILANYAILRKSGKPHVIRVPLIPGVNDGEDNLRATAELLTGDPTLEKVQLLPYHKTAGAKYRFVGRDYAPPFDTERPVTVHFDWFEQYQIKVECL